MVAFLFLAYALGFIHDRCAGSHAEALEAWAQRPLPTTLRRGSVWQHPILFDSLQDLLHG